MPKLIICRGLQASGKTTRAKAWVAENPAGRHRVNRDDLRDMGHDGKWLGNDTEKQIIASRNAMITILLKAGVDVVCDDTNLKQKVFRELVALGKKASAYIEVWDMTDIPLETCITRDKERGGTLWETVIPDYYRRYVRGKGYPLPAEEGKDPTPVEPYVPREGSPPVILVDIDGTVALHGTRSPFDETRVLEDEPNWPVIETVTALSSSGYRPVFLSGRSENCRADTEAWLSKHVYAWAGELYMRAAGDVRNDAIVKREIFDREIRNFYDVFAVLDDRNRVVEMWRSLGLTVFQVAEGDF